MPVLYFWLMGQILFFYVVMTLVVCIFFRKYCQDPKLVRAKELEMKDEFELEKFDNDVPPPNSAKLADEEVPMVTPGNPDHHK